MSLSSRRGVLRDPVIVGLLTLTVLLVVLVAGGFGLLLAGDALGLWEFDSGLGCEKGDGRC